MIMKSVIFVDPYTSSGRLCEALNTVGIKSIAVLTSRIKMTAEMKKLRLPIQQFEAVYDLDEDNYEIMIQQLLHHNPIRVISGCELSTDISDHLGESLCPDSSNPSISSEMRMNKYHMQEALRAAHLNATQQILVTTSTLNQEQLKKLDTFTFPVVIKPAASNGTFGVRYCNNPQEIECIALKLINSVHPRYGAIVKEIVVQECLKGEEYFVDTMSYNGAHKIISVQRYSKFLHNDVPVYRYAEIISNDTYEAQVCTQYVRDVLTATHLFHGFSHTELFLTPKGPFLIEINPRVSGAYGLLNKIAKAAYGIDQADALVQSLTETETFLSEADHFKVCQPAIYSRNIFVQSWTSKIMTEFNKGILSNLPSFCELVILKKAGDTLSEAKELGDVVAMILLQHVNTEQVELDSELIFTWERTGELF
jgi:biotin carboxylase